jgi:S-formylglutathione hydrolase FrmB
MSKRLTGTSRFFAYFNPASFFTRKLIVFGLSLALITTCRTSEEAQAAPDACYRLTPGWQKDLKIDDVSVDLFVPPEQSCQRMLLVLPGWKFPRQDWIRKSPLEAIAQKEQMILVLPEMHTTIYETSYYPETVMKWNAVPGGVFLRDRLIPEMQRRFGLFKKGYGNYLLGLSTGGRGVVMVHLQNPGLFTAGAALSGDFDQTLQPGDNLMRNVYGPYERFRDRWQGEDNPVRVIERSPERWTMPLYLAHGEADRVVMPAHSEWLYKVIVARKGRDFPVVYRSVPGAGHDYRFWAEELPRIFAFFKDPKGMLQKQ